MTIYRIIREEGLLNHRGRACHPRESRPVPMLESKAIHQVLNLDINLEPSPVKGQHNCLYMVMDVWRMRILGVDVHGQDCSLLARDFFDCICRYEGIRSAMSTIRGRYNHKQICTKMQRFFDS
jgi:hypothetical protein